MNQALVIEEDAGAALVLREALDASEFVTSIVADIDAADEALKRAPFPAVVVLGRTGSFSHAEDATLWLRTRLPATVPILTLGRSGTDFERSQVLVAGATDYLAPPVSLPAVAARVRDCLTRTNPSALPTVFVWGNLLLDDRNRRVTRSRKPLHLSPTEYDVLRLLMSAPQTVFSRDEIFSSIWGSASPGSVRSVDAYLKRLRVALQGKHRTTYILAVRGVGYRMNPDAGKRVR